VALAAFARVRADIVPIDAAKRSRMGKAWLSHAWDLNIAWI